MTKGSDTDVWTNDFRLNPRLERSRNECGRGREFAPGSRSGGRRLSRRASPPVTIKKKTTHCGCAR